MYRLKRIHWWYHHGLPHSHKCSWTRITISVLLTQSYRPANLNNMLITTRKVVLPTIVYTLYVVYNFTHSLSVVYIMQQYMYVVSSMQSTFASSSWSRQCPCGCGSVVKRYIHVGTTYQQLDIRHGAERFMGDLEFICYDYHLDRTIPRIVEAVYCLMPSLLDTELFTTIPHPHGHLRPTIVSSNVQGYFVAENKLQLMYW